VTSGFGVVGDGVIGESENNLALLNANAFWDFDRDEEGD
jgi:hypothetical protein